MMTPEDRHSAAERGEAMGEAMPVVQGTPIGNSAASAPPRPMGAVLVAVTPLTVEEQVVLNYRTAVLCFSGLDFATTLLNIIAGLAVSRDLVWFALAIFILGPLSGILGAKHLNRSLVSVYFAFCILKAVAETVFAIYTLWLWNIIFAVVQIWIIKIVATFLFALGRIPLQRRSELLDLKDVAVRMVYW